MTSLLRARALSAVVAVIAIAGVVLLSLPSDSVRRTVRPLAVEQPSPSPTSSVAASPSPTPPGPPATLVPGTPVVVVPVVASQTDTVPVAPPASPTPTPSPTTGTTDPDESSVPPCPLGLAVPAHTGGLQSLIDLSPAFGPFSAEAFALAPAYAPLLTVLGPILAEYPAMAPKLAPLVQPLVGVFAKLTNAGFAFLEPLYAPYRQRVLEAEAQFATAFAPYVKQLADSPVAGCAIAVEALLTSGG